MTGLDIIIVGGAVLLLLVLSAFFSCSETALTAITRARIHALEKEGNARAAKVALLRKKKEQLIGAILLGNNAVNIAASALATGLAITLVGHNGVAYATLFMTLFVLIFAEVMPKTYALQHTEKVALTVAPFFIFLMRVLSPIVRTVEWLVNLIFKLLRINANASGNLISATELIRGAIELQHQEGQMVKQDRDMLGGILDLAQIEIEEIMVHRKNMLILSLDQPMETLVDEALSSPHSRLPLWQDDPDNIVGILHVKNLLRLVARRDVATLSKEEILEIASPPWFVPASTLLKDQLVAFRQKRTHFCLVVDEYGGLLGLATLEDILEEIVGQIEDEHDLASRRIVADGASAYIVHGNVSIRDFNRHSDWNLPDADASTIAGLLIHQVEIIPDVGDMFNFFDCHWTVRAKKGNQITRIRIEKTPLSQK